MTFAQDFRRWVSDNVEADDYDIIEYFWRDLSSSHTSEVAGHTVKLITDWGGPESGQYTWDFVFTADDDPTIYHAEVGYDSYEYASYDYQLYVAEEFEYKETRYKDVSRA